LRFVRDYAIIVLDGSLLAPPTRVVFLFGIAELRSACYINSLWLGSADAVSAVPSSIGFDLVSALLSDERANVRRRIAPAFRTSGSEVAANRFD
jgi:hypothetical protein